MSEPAKVHQSDIPDSFNDDSDLPTNRLHSGHLDGRPPLYLISSKSREEVPEQPIDWVATLATQDISTGRFSDDIPAVQPPSGMSHHATAPRMAPTVGARVSSNLRRTILLIMLGVLVTGVLAGGAYVLTSTPWIGTLIQPASGPAAPPASESNKPPAQPPAQAPQEPVEALPSENGTAAELRDRGLDQYRSGHFNEAIELLENSVGKSGDDAITYYQLGLAYLAVQDRQHSLEDAEMAFRTAASLQPDWAVPQQALAESLLRRGFYKQAIDPALQATRLDTTLADAWLTLGRAYQGAGMKPEATAAFAQAARLAPAPPMQP